MVIELEIIVDRNKLTGSVNLVGTAEKELTPEQAQAMLDSRDTWPGLQEDAALHSDTRLWAALQKKWAAGHGEGVFMMLIEL